MLYAVVIGIVAIVGFLIVIEVMVRTAGRKYGLDTSNPKDLAKLLQTVVQEKENNT